MTPKFPWRVLRAALDAGPEKAHWSRQLGVLLIGKAQATHGAMTRDKALDYDKVKRNFYISWILTQRCIDRLFKPRKGSKGSVAAVSQSCN